MELTVKTMLRQQAPVAVIVDSPPVKPAWIADSVVKWRRGMYILMKCLMYSSKTWSTKSKHEVQLDGTEMRINQFFGCMLEGNEEKCRELMGLEPADAER